MGSNIDFSNKELFEIPIKLFGENIIVTETIRNTWIVMLFLFVFGIIVKLALKNFDTTPKGFQNFIESLVSGLNKMVTNVMGDKNKKFAAYFGSVFIFILCANLIGLLGLRPPTADIATTLTLAALTFFLVQFMGIKSKGFLGYIKSFFEPLPALFPLNIIGEVANPISLGFRLFGNILGGLIIMSLYYNLIPIVFRFGIPAALHVYFDLFAGILQTFIFVMLSMTFVSGAMNE